MSGSENENFNPFLSPKPFPVTVYVRLTAVYPCIPQELLLRQHAKSFGISDYTPAALVEALFPGNDLLEYIPPKSVGEAVYDSIRRNKTIRLPPLPKENIRCDLLAPPAQKKVMSPLGVRSMFSFPQVGSSISCVCLLRDKDEPFLPEENVELLVGYDTGTVILMSLKYFGAELDSLRKEEMKANIFGEHTEKNPETKRLGFWGSSKVPSGVELQGYHGSGTVVCATHDYILDVGVTGSADGALYLWDIRNRFGTSRKNLINQSQLSRTPAAFQFSEAVRFRRMCGYVKTAHEGPVSAMSMYSTFLITGGADQKVKIWTSTIDKEGFNPTYVGFQEFRMEGWIRSITAAPFRGIQLEDVLITDDSGVMMGLKACTAEMKVVFSRSSSTSSTRSLFHHRATDGELTFCTTRVHHFFSEEGLRLGPARVKCKNEVSNTMIRVVPVMNYSSLLSVTFSPVAQFMDYGHLRVSRKIQHPTLTALGAKVKATAASSVYHLENKRRQRVFHEADDSEEKGGIFEPKATKKADNARAEPLRFVDSLYIPAYDMILLLDNRNTVFVFEQNSNDILAQVTISSKNEDQKPKKAVSFLPIGKCYNECLSSMSKAASLDNSHKDEDFRIPFLVVTNKSIELFHILPTKPTLVEVPAHKSAVIGLACRHQEIPLDVVQTVEEKAAEEARNLFISVSRDGALICWGRGLNFLRSYDQCNAVSSKNGSSPTFSTKQKMDKSEVTTFLFSEKWGFAITGHESGDIKYWGCDEELSDIWIRERCHKNTISGLAEASAMQNRSGKGDDEENLLISVSYDGYMGIWKSPERRSALLKDKIHISSNELLCVGFSRAHSVYVSGDSAGALYLICAKDRVVLSVISEGPDDLSLLGRRKPSINSMSSHFAPVTAISLMTEDCFLTCDEDGFVVMWSLPDWRKRNVFTVRSPNNDEEYSDELNLLTPVSPIKFVAAARSGHVYLFDASIDAQYPIGMYKHTCEVCSLVVHNVIRDSFQFLVGGADGSITSLESGYFQEV